MSISYNELHNINGSSIFTLNGRTSFNGIDSVTLNNADLTNLQFSNMSGGFAQISSISANDIRTITLEASEVTIQHAEIKNIDIGTANAQTINVHDLTVYDTFKVGLEGGGVGTSTLNGPFSNLLGPSSFSTSSFSVNTPSFGINVLESVALGTVQIYSGTAMTLSSPTMYIGREPLIIPGSAADIISIGSRLSITSTVDSTTRTLMSPASIKIDSPLVAIGGVPELPTDSITLNAKGSISAGAGIEGTTAILTMTGGNVTLSGSTMNLGQVLDQTLGISESIFIQTAITLPTKNKIAISSPNINIGSTLDNIVTAQNINIKTTTIDPENTININSSNIAISAGTFSLFGSTNLDLSSSTILRLGFLGQEGFDCPVTTLFGSEQVNISSREGAISINSPNINIGGNAEIGIAKNIIIRTNDKNLDDELNIFSPTINIRGGKSYTDSSTYLRLDSEDIVLYGPSIQIGDLNPGVKQTTNIEIQSVEKISIIGNSNTGNAPIVIKTKDGISLNDSTVGINKSLLVKDTIYLGTINGIGFTAQLEASGTYKWPGVPFAIEPTPAGETIRAFLGHDGGGILAWRNQIIAKFREFIMPAYLSCSETGSGELFWVPPRPYAPPLHPGEIRYVVGPMLIYEVGSILKWRSFFFIMVRPEPFMIDTKKENLPIIESDVITVEGKQYQIPPFNEENNV